MSASAPLSIGLLTEWLSRPRPQSPGVGCSGSGSASAELPAPLRSSDCANIFARN